MRLHNDSDQYLVLGLIKVKRNKMSDSHNLIMLEISSDVLEMLERSWPTCLAKALLLSGTDIDFS